MNVVCGAAEEPVAVLLRALEPTEGPERMRQHRLAPRRGRGASSNDRTPMEGKSVAHPGRSAGTEAVDGNPASGQSRLLADRELCSGPAKLCQAMAIDRRHNLIDLSADDRLWIEVLRERPALPPARSLGNTARIGVGYAGPWAIKPLRWFLTPSVHVSRLSRS
jgi:3-methyladenine DNA glycosylase Mpg